MPRDADPLFRFERDGKVGFIDATGKVVIEPTLPGDIENAFHDGLLSLSNGKGPFIDSTGKELVRAEFDTVLNFHGGFAPAIANGLYGFIGRSGAWAITPRFPSYPEGLVASFSEGLAMVETHGNVGFIDRSGEFVISPQYLSASNFSEGVARVLVSGPCVNRDPNLPPVPCGNAEVYPREVSQNESSLPRCRWSFVDKSGKRLFNSQFEDAGDFHEGLAAVKIAGKWGFIDKRGNRVIPSVFDYVTPFSEGRRSSPIRRPPGTSIPRGGFNSSPMIAEPSRKV
jgi:hypothetical protein